MAWQKGLPKPKTGGRMKGSVNKRTLMLRDTLDSLSLDIPRKLAEILPQLKAKEQADILLGLMPYAFPKLNSLTVSPEPLPETAYPNFSGLTVEELHAHMNEILTRAHQRESS